MEIIFHKTTQSRYADKLLETISSVVKESDVHVTGDLESFTRVLLNYRIQMPIIVIYVGSIEDVSKIKGLSDILDGLFLIVCADGGDAGLLMSCRQLYPRLLTRNNEDLDVVAAVIERRLTMNCQSHLKNK